MIVLTLYLSSSTGQVQPQQSVSGHLNGNAARTTHPMGKINNMGYSKGEFDQLGIAAQQNLLYTAEESLQQQAAARLSAHIADFSQAGGDPRLRGPFLEGALQGFGDFDGGLAGTSAHYGGTSVQQRRHRVSAVVRLV